MMTSLQRTPRLHVMVSLALLVGASGALAARVALGGAHSASGADTVPFKLQLKFAGAATELTALADNTDAGAAVQSWAAQLAGIDSQSVSVSVQPPALTATVAGGVARSVRSRLEGKLKAYTAAAQQALQKRLDAAGLDVVPVSITSGPGGVTRGTATLTLLLHGGSANAQNALSGAAGDALQAWVAAKASSKPGAKAARAGVPADEARVAVSTAPTGQLRVRLIVAPSGGPASTSRAAAALRALVANPAARTRTNADVKQLLAAAGLAGLEPVEAEVAGGGGKHVSGLALVPSPPPPPPSPPLPAGQFAMPAAKGVQSPGCNWKVKQAALIPNQKTAASLGRTPDGRTVLWQGDMTRGWCSFAALVEGHYRKWPHSSFVPDLTPAGFPGGGEKPPQQILRVTYPGGTWSTSSGINLDAFPFADGRIGPSATLTFSAYFPPNFDWVYGGKLMGLHSGRACSGGQFRADCFSVRICFANDGGVFAYIYAPVDRQHADFKRIPAFKQGKVGFIAARTWDVLQRGRWNTFKLRVVVNTPGLPDGLLQMTVNGREFINFDKMYWRHTPDQLLDSIFMQTFFGGSEDWWAPKATQQALFRDFMLTD